MTTSELERTRPRKKVREGEREREKERQRNQVKLMKQAEENGQKTGALWGLAGPDFGPAKLFSGKFVTLVARHHGHLSRYAKPAKSNEANSRKWPKTPFRARFYGFWPDFRRPHFFQANWLY